MTTDFSEQGATSKVSAISRIYLTSLTLPGGHQITLDPPVMFDAGEALPLTLTLGVHTLGVHPIVQAIAAQWYEVPVEEAGDDYDW